MGVDEEMLKNGRHSLLEILPRDLGIRVEVACGTLAAAEQIPRVEWVVHIPPNTCSSLQVLEPGKSATLMRTSGH